jgi:hypothetical protein
MDEKTLKILQVIAALIVVYLIYKLIKSVGQKLNIVDDENDETAAVLTADKGNIFSPNYWKKKKSPKLLTTDSARDMAKRLYNSSGLFNDNEEAVYGVFRQLTYRTQVSWLSYIFYKTYGEDLLQHLKSFMNSDELATLKQITDKLK